MRNFGTIKEITKYALHLNVNNKYFCIHCTQTKISRANNNRVQYRAHERMILLCCNRLCFML